MAQDFNKGMAMDRSECGAVNDLAEILIAALSAGMTLAMVITGLFVLTVVAVGVMAVYRKVEYRLRYGNRS